MNAKLLFEDDDFLFAPAANERESRVEIRIDGEGSGNKDERATQPDLALAEDYFGLVPTLAVQPNELALLPLDHREGFLLSRVDGMTTIETILDLCAMPAEEALAIIDRLVQRGVLLIPR